jgi:hypothetical protein
MILCIPEGGRERRGKGEEREREREGERMNETWEKNKEREPVGLRESCIV